MAVTSWWCIIYAKSILFTSRKARFQVLFDALTIFLFKLFLIYMLLQVRWIRIKSEYEYINLVLVLYLESMVWETLIEWIFLELSMPSRIWLLFVAYETRGVCTVSVSAPWRLLFLSHNSLSPALIIRTIVYPREDGQSSMLGCRTYSIFITKTKTLNWCSYHHFPRSASLLTDLDDNQAQLVLFILVSGSFFVSILKVFFFNYKLAFICLIVFIFIINWPQIMSPSRL